MSDEEIIDTYKTITKAQHETIAALGELVSTLTKLVEKSV